MSGEGLIAEPRAVHAGSGPGVGHARLKELMHRGTEFLGCEVAIMGGAMSWVSERNLVSAISNAGGFGVIACGAMSPELLDTEIAETKARTARPFGVNLITMHPQLSELIDVCAKHQVGHVVLAGGLPPGGAIERIKSTGARLVCFSPALALARKLMRSGADALVIEGMEAGGHIGPVSTSVLAQEILPMVAKVIPVFVAGGIGRGEAIAAYLEMGAVGVQLGTRFVCANESIAHANFKKAFIRASARDAIPSVQIDPRLPVIPVRALKNREMENFAAKQREVAQKLDDGAIEMAEAQLQIEHYWAGALRRAVIDGDVESGSVMAGQSVGMVNREEPVAAIIQELVEEAAAALESRGSSRLPGRAVVGHPFGSRFTVLSFVADQTRRRMEQPTIMPKEANDTLCRRESDRELVSLAASALALGCSRSVIISDLSPAGAQLAGRGLPPPGDDLLMVAGSFETFATVVWRTDDKCGIHFDDAVPANDLACMKKEASWMSVAGWYR